MIKYKFGSVGEARWRAAQKCELDFWGRWTTLPPYQNLDVPRYWREEVAHFGTAWACFDGRRVLDVGCGPYGLIHFIEHAAERILVDPLLPQYAGMLPLDGQTLSVCAMAESLPLASQSIDLAICFNALDHMQDPVAALDEIARVLRPGGSAMLMIHTFPGWLWPLFRLDRMHPHHFTASSFVRMAGERFRVERAETIPRPFDTSTGTIWSRAFWKYRAGALVVSSTYVRARVPGVTARLAPLSD